MARRNGRLRSVRHTPEFRLKVLRTSLEKKLTPKRRGPKRSPVDPQVTDLQEKLRRIERERELLAIKTQNLEEIQRELVARGIAGKKGRTKRSSNPSTEDGTRSSTSS